MKAKSVLLILTAISAVCSVPTRGTAQTSTAELSSVVSTVSRVPKVVAFNGALTELNGKPLIGVAGVTFSLYRNSQGGAPLWMETQNVHLDKTGHYSIMLGSTTAQGLPADVFISGEARWLAVQVQGQEEQSRVLLVAVPYALKAGDAETVGGLPASAFMLAAPSTAGTSAVSADTQLPSPSLPPPPAAITGSGTANFLPRFTATATIGNSAVFQAGASPSAKIGINNSAPIAALDVTGTANISGQLTLPSNGIASAAGGKRSQPLNMRASAFNSGSATAVQQNFQWVAEPAGNNTATPSGTLNLLFAQGPTASAETGFRISRSGIVTFAAGQTFPGGSGTVTRVNTGLGLTGGPITTTGTISINPAIVPQLNVANTFTTSQTVTGDITANGTITAGNSMFAKRASIDGNDNSNVLQITNSNAGNGTTGVFALADPSTGATLYGITGWNANPFASQSGEQGGAGVLGIAGGKSGALANVFATAGTWGDGGSFADGLVGTADGGNAVFAENDTAEFYTLFAFNETNNGFPFGAFNNVNAGCYIDPSGDMVCTGSFNPAVALDHGKRTVSMANIGSPKNWFEDFGSQQLSRGAAIVNFDSDFAQTVNTGVEYHVFLTPNGDCKGLYVARKTATSFEVRELGGGASSVSFDYRIVALRRNFENVRMQDRTAVAPTAKSGRGHAPAKVALVKNAAVE
jgi:hypothetical protein